MSKKIYLDHAATSPISDNVKKQIINEIDHWHNPNSIYEDGQINKYKIKLAKTVIASFIGAEPDEIVFTSGGSEANALAIDGFLRANLEFDRCIGSSIEHSSILNNPNCYPQITCDKSGFINMSSLPNYPAFCAVMMVNNEIGTIQPIKKIAQKIHSCGGILLCDGVQALGKQYIDVKDLDVDMMSFSGHKIGALKGIGFLYVRKGIQLAPIIHGTQENNLRGGTYNTLGIISLRAAIQEWNFFNNNKIRWLRDKLIEGLTQIDGVILNGSYSFRCVSNINVRINTSLTGQQIVTLLENMGFQISAGSACHEGDAAPSHVLKAIGLSDDEANRSIRITLGAENTEKDIEAFLDTLSEIIALSE